MIDVKVTVAIGGRTLRLDEVRDARVRTGLLGAAKQVGTALDGIRCPTHEKGPSNVRVHFDKNGAADLQYDSCCAALGDKIKQALG